MKYSYKDNYISYYISYRNIEGIRIIPLFNIGIELFSTKTIGISSTRNIGSLNFHKWKSFIGALRVLLNVKYYLGGKIYDFDTNTLTLSLSLAASQIRLKNIKSLIKLIQNEIRK
jgi:hypothetical protein